MELVKVAKERLQNLRDGGWYILFGEVSSFCEKNKISIPSMNDFYVPQGRVRRKVIQITNLNRYKVDLFYVVVDRQREELNNRFTEITTELLLCVACLSPKDTFSSFDKDKLIRMARLYPFDFSPVDVLALDSQLETFILDVRSNSAFIDITEVGCLAQNLVETKKHIVYPLVFLLVKLALLLPVATATVERAFSAMKFVKNRLRNRMGDAMMNDVLVTFIEKDIFKSVDK
ncbi:unnamed protein product [Cuscuta europaea]|uniref:HAT C-terminal dimerisation domain-containing protein n=1 Tax=Cuscuta europaea TaxID=41803 RepID=A0A9P0ZH84_CUSEU|nr:unnamed protein product [Cuscuta europaea]